MTKWVKIREEDCLSNRRGGRKGEWRGGEERIYGPPTEVYDLYYEIYIDSPRNQSI